MEIGLELGNVFAAIIAAAVTIGSLRLKAKLKEKKGRGIDYDPDMHSNVLTALEYMRQETEADRVYILEFHNGEHYFSGRSQQKFSCTYEVVNEGISREVQELQNIRVSSMHCLIKDVVVGETFEYQDMNDSCNDLSFKSFMNTRGIKSMFARPIKTLNGKIIGVVVMDFVKDHRKWGKNAEEFLNKQAKIISGYLM